MRGEIVTSRFACLFLRSVTSGDTATLEEVEIVYSQQCVDRSGVLNVDKKTNVTNMCNCFSSQET